MKRNACGIAALTALGALIAAASACQSTSITSAAPVAPGSVSASGNEGAGGAGGPSLKAGTPVAVSPLNNVTTATLTPTFAITGGGLTYSTAAVEYRFRVTDPAGTIAADSGLVSGATWTAAAPLTPKTKYTWIARSEYQGLNG